MKKISVIFGKLMILLLVLGTTPVTGSRDYPKLPESNNEITALSFVGHLDTPGTADDIVVQGNYAYLCDRSAVRIIDVSNPTAPTEVGSYTSSCYDIALAGNYVVFVANNLIIIDVSTPTAPTLVGQLSTGYWPRTIDIQGSYAYLGEGKDIGYWVYRLAIVDISSPSSPFLISTKSFTDDLRDVDAVGNYAYVANDDNGLRIIDISDPYNLSEVGTYDSPSYSWGVTVVSNLAYLSEGDGFRIVDVSDPAAPSFLSFYAKSVSYFYDSVVTSGIAYIANGSNGVIMLDVSDPSVPKSAGAYDTAGNAYDIAQANGLVYVADGGNGLVILQPSFKITGIVNDLFGGLMPDVTLTATGGYSSVTDQNGVYSLTNLPPGTYTVIPSKKDYTFTPLCRVVVLPPDASMVNFTGETHLYLPMVIK